MGCLKRKLEHWKHKTWIQKPLPNPKNWESSWSFEVALEGAGERIRGIHVPFSESFSMAANSYDDNSVLES